MTTYQFKPAKDLRVGDILIGGLGQEFPVARVTSDKSVYVEFRNPMTRKMDSTFYKLTSEVKVLKVENPIGPTAFGKQTYKQVKARHLKAGDVMDLPRLGSSRITHVYESMPMGRVYVDFYHPDEIVERSFWPEEIVSIRDGVSASQEHQEAVEDKSSGIRRSNYANRLGTSVRLPRNHKARQMRRNNFARKDRVMQETIRKRQDMIQWQFDSDMGETR